MARKSVKDSGLEKAMADSLKAYASGSPRFFDYLKNDVRVYNLNSAEPMVGRKTFESAFENFRSKRNVSVVDQDVRESDRQAVLAQTLQFKNGDVSLFVRQTVVWENDGDNWQMSHIHNTQVGQPVTAKIPDTARGVQVLNERIATTAAAVGVAQ